MKVLVLFWSCFGLCIGLSVGFRVCLGHDLSHGCGLGFGQHLVSVKVLRIFLIIFLTLKTKLFFYFHEIFGLFTKRIFSYNFCNS